MSEVDPLIAAVAAAPADDTPRLVYADRLDELGGAENAARAALIRLQVAAAREFPGGPACARTAAPVGGPGTFTARCRCRACRLGRAAWRHLARYRGAWERAALAPVWDEYVAAVARHAHFDLGRMPARRLVRCEWTRGFVGGLVLDQTAAAAWMRLGDALRAINPLTRVTWTVRDGDSAVAVTGRLLTTRPGRAVLAADPTRTEFDYAPRGDRIDMADALAARWPGVEFRFGRPAAPPNPET